MAINLAAGQDKKLQYAFYKDSFIKTNFNQEISFSGKNTVTVLTPVTVPLNTYARNDNLSATPSRYGVYAEVQDTKQDLQLTQDKSFNLTLERSNREDQEMAKSASGLMRSQIREQVTPMLDKYALSQWANATAFPGITVYEGEEIDKTNVTERVMMAETSFTNNLVPDQDRFLYIGASVYGFLRLSPEFVGSSDRLTNAAISKGYVGMIGSMHVIRVPDSFLPADTNFIATYKNSVLAPLKIDSARIVTEQTVVDGWVMQGHYYYDAFVINAKAKGVYVDTADTESV